MKTKHIVRKTFKIRESGRSTDFITPSFINECGLSCSYCYVKRHGVDTISIAKNNGDILTAINNHVTWLPKKQSNQTHDKYWTYDISCNSDLAFHRKQVNWKYIFDFFKTHNTAYASLATKVIPNDFLQYNPHNKVRIRFSLMPQKISSILEPHTPSILDRIKAIDKFKKAGYDVHINFSPIVVYKGWLNDYTKLFEQIDSNVENKHDVLSECIFLTHNENKHASNMQNNIKGEQLLWAPNIQEQKTSSYGGENVRYKAKLKSTWIDEFKDIHASVIPWNTIRYIF